MSGDSEIIIIAQNVCPVPTVTVPHIYNLVFSCNSACRTEYMFMCILWNDVNLKQITSWTSFINLTVGREEMVDSPLCTPDITMSIQSKINVSSARWVARKKTSKKLKRFQWFSDWGREIWLIVATWAWALGRWSYFKMTLPLILLLVLVTMVSVWLCGRQS